MGDIAITPVERGALRLDTPKAVSLACVIVLVVHAVAAIGLNLGSYADGAWFDFALLTGDPFQLVWRNHPWRLAHYLVVYLPSLLLLKLHAPQWLALLVAHSIWHLAPLASIWACWRLGGESWRRVVVPSVYFAALGLMSWGFPTEAILLAVFAWPAFFALSFGRGAGAVAAGTVAIIACAISYEGAPLLLPLFALATLSNDDRRLSLLTAVVGTIAALAALAVALCIAHPSAVAAAALQQRLTDAMDQRLILAYPTFRKGAEVFLVMDLSLALSLLLPRWRRPVLWLLCAAAAALALWPMSGTPGGRYPIRTVIVVGLIAAQGMMLIVRRRPSVAAFFAGSSPIFATAVFSLLVAVSVENWRFGRAWTVYSRTTAAEANCGREACAATRFQPFDLGPAGSMPEWPWGMPFRSWLAADDPTHMNVLLDHDPHSYFPLQCDDAKMLARRADGARYAAMEKLACMER